jgi:hypothetical protein
MAHSKQNQCDGLAIGTFSILRTLIELDQAGAVNLPFDEFVEAQREQGDPNHIADAIETIRSDIAGSNIVKQPADY